MINSVCIQPQQYQRELNYPTVIGLNDQYKNTFSGGFNNLEHHFIDIDNDDDLDLFFLNSDGTYGWFENIGDKFNYDLKMSLDSIPGMYFSDWFYFADIDDDGDYDIFTGNIENITLLINTGTAETPEFVVDQEIVLDAINNPIASEFGSNPIFVDIDNDGDLDFISGNSAGTVTFYENIGSPQSYNFQFITNNWQDILIIGGGISDDPMHGSSSLEFVDIDSDEDMDLFWGDFFSRSLYVLENKGTSFNPDMDLISNIYPQNNDSILTSGYNMPRFADIDANGTFDLFVSVLYDPTVPQSLMYFNNTGTAEQPDHIKITDDFLYTLDVGNNSHPVFTDIDSDGDMDLFIGSLNNPEGSLHFFENEGSASDPLFVYKDNLFADIQYELSVIPAFGDLDNDNDSDLLIGKFNGRVSFYRNVGQPNNPQYIFIDDLRDINNQIIDIGTSASPFLTDIDSDLDLDLVIGSFNGQFYLYRNVGDAHNFSFQYDENYFAGIDVGDNSTPVLVDYSGDGKMELFSGTRHGSIFHYVNAGTIEVPDWILASDNFLDKNFGGYSVPCFVDINNDSDNDLMFGNVKGGLYFYKNLSVSNVSDRENIPSDYNMLEIFPNPFNPNLNIVVNALENGDYTIVIFNILGEKIKEIYNGYLDAGKHLFGWDGTNDSYVSLPAGNYFILLRTEHTHFTAKISYLK